GSGTLAIDTTGATVRINGPVTLDSALSIATAGGNILFPHAETIDSQAGENNDVTLSSAAGTITFNADVGGGVRLGKLTVKGTTGQLTFGGGGADGGLVAHIRTAGAID